MCDALLSTSDALQSLFAKERVSDRDVSDEL